MSLKVKVVKNKSVSLDNFPPAQLIASCFAARTQAHILHLQSQSYSQHKALETFYNELILLVDAYAESFQGRFGIIAEYPNSSYAGLDAIKVVTELRSTIDVIRVNCGSTSELQNDIDSIVTLCNTTLYKLQNLR